MIFFLRFLLVSTLFFIHNGLTAQGINQEKTVKAVYELSFSYEFPNDSTLRFTLSFPETLKDEYLDLAGFNPVSFINTKTFTYQQALKRSFPCREGIFIRKGDLLFNGFDLFDMKKYEGFNCCWKDCEDSECFMPFRDYEKNKQFSFETYCNKRIWKEFNGYKFVYVYNTYNTKRRYVFVSDVISYLY